MDCVAAWMLSIYVECAGSEQGEHAELSQQIVATNRSEVFFPFCFDWSCRVSELCIKQVDNIVAKEWFGTHLGFVSDILFLFCFLLRTLIFHCEFIISFQYCYRILPTFIFLKKREKCFFSTDLVDAVACDLFYLSKARVEHQYSEILYYAYSWQHIVFVCSQQGNNCISLKGSHGRGKKERIEWRLKLIENMKVASSLSVVTQHNVEFS